MEYKKFIGSNDNVIKFVFTGEDYVLESVLYKYPEYMERTVICCSVMSGCPVGCTFCGTGNKFIKNISSDLIVEQINTVLEDVGIRYNMSNCKKFQIMFMSMGEPLLNWDNVETAIRELNVIYPNAQLLLSTIAPKKPENFKRLIDLAVEIDKVGLQFSVHKSNDEARTKLIPYVNKYTLRQIRDIGILFYARTGRKAYCNYCIDGTNNTMEDANNLLTLFSPTAFCFTFSVVCSADETMKDAGFRNLDVIRQFEEMFIKEGYNTRIFDPAGQDDIGGGCGQLWYVQDWMKNHKKGNE